MLAMTSNPLQHELLRTSEAAPLLRVEPQAMRRWACYGKGPLTPIKVGHRLLWRAADIRRLIESGQEKAEA